MNQRPGTSIRSHHEATKKFLAALEKYQEATLGITQSTTRMLTALEKIQSSTSRQVTAISGFKI